MSIYLLSDPHLCFSTPEKSMEHFGPPWIGYLDKIKTNFEKKIKNEDLVLIPGDISWASKFEQALIDLKWLDNLPGQKLILKGNHDDWWPSSTKLKESLPSSIHFIKGNSLQFKDVSITGSRLWDSPDFNFDPYINAPGYRCSKNPIEGKRLYDKELLRLKATLLTLNAKSSVKIVMTHFPPISADLKDSTISKMYEEAGVNIAVFGHLHSLKKGPPLFGTKNNIQYVLGSADYLGFQPLKILDKDTTL